MMHYVRSKFFWLTKICSINPCTVDIALDSDLEPPIFIYYEL